MNIGIGDLVAIELKLDVSEYSPSELVNRVEVCGGINNGEDWVCASNFSDLEVEWLTCCPGGPISVETSGEVENECGPVSCDSWQPPNWEFISNCDENCDLAS